MTTLVAYLDKRLGLHIGYGPEYKWHCPACIDRLGHESASPKLHINVDGAVGHCFRCGFAFRSLESLFRFINNGALRVEEARLIRKTAGIGKKGPVASVMEALTHEKPRRKTQLAAEELPSEMQALGLTPPLAGTGRAMTYLKGRGVTREMIRRHNIGFCPEGDYRGYLVFPVTIDHELVYFTTRAVWKNARRKSKNPKAREGYHTKGTCLLNYDNVVGAKTVVVVEGAFDMMAFDHAVGAMGKDLSAEQIELLEQLVPHGLEEVVIALDPDAGREAEATFRTLRGRVPKVSVLLIDHGDPWDRRDDLSRLLEDRTHEMDTVARVRARMQTGRFVRRRVKANGFSRARHDKR